MLLRRRSRTILQAMSLASPPVAWCRVACVRISEHDGIIDDAVITLDDFARKRASRLPNLNDNLVNLSHAMDIRGYANALFSHYTNNLQHSTECRGIAQIPESFQCPLFLTLNHPHKLICEARSITMTCCPQ
jgi:hypothetical protein